MRKLAVAAGLLSISAVALAGQLQPNSQYTYSGNNTPYTGQVKVLTVHYVTGGEKEKAQIPVYYANIKVKYKTAFNKTESGNIRVMSLYNQNSVEGVNEGPTNMDVAKAIKAQHLSGLTVFGDQLIQDEGTYNLKNNNMNNPGSGVYFISGGKVSVPFSNVAFTYVAK